MTLTDWLAKVRGRIEHDRGAFDIRNHTDLETAVRVIEVYEKALSSIVGTEEYNILKERHKMIADDALAEADRIVGGGE